MKSVTSHHGAGGLPRSVGACSAARRQEYQRHFLRTASRLLRPGGTLVYSTCTLTAEENEENVAWALASLPLDLEDAR